MTPASILIVDDDVRFGRSLARSLLLDGHRADVESLPEQALARLERHAYDLVFTDLVMPGTDGLELLGRAKRIRPSCEVVLITGHPTFHTVQSAFRNGARDYFTKPLAIDDEVRPLVRSVLRGPGPMARAPCHETGFAGVAEPGGAMDAVLRRLPRVATSSAPVLLLGESGTGKELVAAAIHRLSARAERPFVRVNCAAIHESLIDAELFGAARGAFTGATQDRPGYFEAADGGTLLLDELAEASPTLQAKLLRVLQDGTFHRVGDATSHRHVDVRVVAATNRDLDVEAREGRFRRDLLYRLQVLPLHLPALRERRRELPALVSHFAAQLGASEPVELEPEALAVLERHPWPGNVRELRNAVEHALVLGDGRRLRRQDLPVAIREGEVAAPAHDFEPLEASEIRQIREALRRAGFNRSRAAELLGITRRTLGYRMRKYGLDLETPGQASLPGFSGPPGSS